MIKFPGTGDEVTEVLGIVARAYRTHRSSGYGYRRHGSSGYCGTGVQKSQKFRAGKKSCTRTPDICGTGVQNLQIPGTGVNVVHNLHKFRVRV